MADIVVLIKRYELLLYEKSKKFNMFSNFEMKIKQIYMFFKVEVSIFKTLIPFSIKLCHVGDFGEVLMAYAAYLIQKLDLQY